jgi:hypothetical protein
LPNPNFIHEVHAVAIDHEMAVMQVQVGENYTRGCPIKCFEGQKMEKNRTHLFLEHEEGLRSKTHTHIYIYIRELLINLSAIACSVHSQL